MSLLSYTKITVAIVGSVALVAVFRWMTAYKVPGETESRVDLATAQRSWPQALESEEARGRLLSYMRNMPKEVASNVAPGATPAAAPPKPPLDLPTRLARADVAKGERSVSKCAICHTIEKDGPVRIGPNLWGVVGRPVAKAAGFSYSDGMKEKGEKIGTWAPNELDIFLTKPENVVPGTRMTFPGLPDQQERADIITYLNTQSDNPLPHMRNMPKEVASNVAPGATPAPPPPEPPLDLPTRLARADVAKGERSVSKCAVCHTIEKGGPVRIGPNLWGVVGRPVAKAAGFSYSDGMKEKGEKTGTWVPNELDIFLTKPENVVPGTRMTFPGLPDQQERANVILYLNTQSDNPLPLPKAPG
jgi:cytochrome c2